MPAPQHTKEHVWEVFIEAVEMELVEDMSPGPEVVKGEGTPIQEQGQLSGRAREAGAAVAG